MICTSLLDWPGLVPGLFFFQTKREGATDAAMGFPCCAGGAGQAGGLTDHRKVTLQLFLLAMASASCFAVGIVLAPFGLRHLSALSGAAIYSLRIGRDRAETLRLTKAFSGMWQGSGRWRWLSVPLILIGFALLPALILQAGG